MNAEQLANALKSEREAEMKYRSISDQERQINELRAMVEQMMNSQQQQPAQAAPATAPPAQQAPATPLVVSPIPAVASPPRLSTRARLDEGRERPLQQRSGSRQMPLPETVGLVMMDMTGMRRTRRRKEEEEQEGPKPTEATGPILFPFIFLILIVYSV